MLRAFNDLGYEIHLFSSEDDNDNPWSNDSVEYLKRNLVKDIHLYKNSRRDYLIQKIFRKFYKITTKKNPPEFLLYRLAPDYRSWFSLQTESIDPKIIMMNYAQFDGLLDHKRFHSILRVIDAIDLRSLNLSRQDQLNTLLFTAPFQLSPVDERILQEDFYKITEIKVDKQEYHIFDKYSATIAISMSEADIIRKNTRKTRVHFIPMMQEARFISNQYSGPAIFPMGPNPFNIQGYLYFARRVLPLVLKEFPDFNLQISGTTYSNISLPQVPGITILGYVPELLPYYALSSFAISPVFGGTGQQIKIIEAMAHGLAVVALEEAAKRSPLEHMQNGLVAHDAREFAEHVCRLWRDRELCRRLGRAARNTIHEKYSQERLNSEISRLLLNQ